MEGWQVGVAGLCGYFCDGDAAVRQQRFGALRAEFLRVLREREACSGCESALEASGGHSGNFSQVRDGCRLI